MGKVALLAVAAFAVYGSVHAVGVVQGRQDVAVREAESEYRLLARQAARAGLALAQQGLAEDFAAAVHMGTFDGVDYEAVVQVDTDTATVRSVATVPGPRGRPVSFAVSARYERMGIGLDGQPADLSGFFRNLLFVDGDLTIDGSAQIRPEPPSTSNELLVHTNSNFHAKKGNSIQGQATYVESATGGDIDGNPEQRDPIAFPEIVPDDIIKAYGGADRVFNSSATGSGTFQGGTRKDPVVYHIKGDLQLNNLHVTGYAVFVVNGSVNVGGHFSGSNPSGIHESTLALYTPGNISLSGNTSLNAQIVAGGSLSYNGTVDITGTVAVRNSLSVGGTADIHHRPASPPLGRGVGERVIVKAAYSEY